MRSPAFSQTARRGPRARSSPPITVATAERSAARRGLTLERRRLVLGAVGGQEPIPAVLRRLQMHGPPPEAVHVLQGVLGLLDVQGHSLEPVLQVQLAPVGVVRVLHLDQGLPEVGQGEEQLLLHLAPIPAHDHVLPRAGIEAVDVELEPLAELLVQEGVNEGNVVVDLPHLEALLPAQAQPAVPAAAHLEVIALLVLLPELPLVPTVLDLPQELDPDLVGVEP